MKIKVPGMKMTKCRLVWCVDPKTRMVKLSFDGRCPPGYRRRVVREATEALGRGVIAPREDEE